ncbi:MAG: FliH/SctL family protein [Thermodesulfobacteriota bacterium]|nr:FliH/SctL family protein [Thermodesulfobacteriota bacterium]
MLDAEEKSSLHKAIEADRLNLKRDIEVYCFPDIPVERSLNRKICTDEEAGFQRIDFQENSGLIPESHEKIMPDGRCMEMIRERAREIEEQAYVKGFTKGEKAGMESGNKKAEPVLNNFYQAVLELEKVNKEIHMNAERESVELALAIAKKVVCHEISTNKEVVINIVKEALKRVMDDDKIRIRISPSDVQFVKNARMQFSDLVDNIEEVTFEEDERILAGGCVIETNSGNIDARIDKKLQAVEEALKSELQESQFRG